MVREIDRIMIEQPAFAIGQMEGPDLVLGTDDTLEFVRRNNPNRHFVDLHHGSTPYSFATQEDLRGIEGEEADGK